MNFAIIAAGEGSRLAREGVAVPKPLVCINGEPLLDRLIRIFAANGADSISLIVNENMPEVRKHVLAMHPPVSMNLIVRATPSSMHSFAELSPFLAGKRFCLATVDTVFREDEFAAYIKAFNEETTVDGLMAVTEYIDDEKPLYVNTDDNLSIRSFTDQPASDGSRFVSGGVYCLEPSALIVLQKTMAEGQSRMRNFQRTLLREQANLRAWPFSKIIDIDHASDIAKAEEMLASTQTKDIRC
jgi:NDP-sugar pyrophosphorylase family protein